MSIPPRLVLQSPSLGLPGREQVAFEIKFLLSEAQAMAVQKRVESHLVLDPHGVASLCGAYRTTSVYSDTQAFDVFHRTPSFKRRKFRVRCYGAAAEVFLERKSKWGDRVRKRRSSIPCHELENLAKPPDELPTPDAHAPDAGWAGDWFRRRLQVRRLQPSCRVRYDRMAFLGMNAADPVRITFDRDVWCQPASDWSPTPFQGGLPVLRGQVIAELKFRDAMPLLFKDLVAAFLLQPTSVSKYRLGVAAWGLASCIGREVR